jgi:hypothetical protein
MKSVISDDVQLYELDYLNSEIIYNKFTNFTINNLTKLDNLYNIKEDIPIGEHYTKILFIL